MTLENVRFLTRGVTPEEKAAVLAVLDLGDFDLRTTDWNDLVGAQGLLVGLRNGIVDGLVQDGAPAEALLDDSRRNLALAEPRDAHLLGNARICRIQGRLHLVKGHLDRELDSGRGQGLDVALHF